jgi:hypothetical protein
MRAAVVAAAVVVVVVVALWWLWRRSGRENLVLLNIEKPPATPRVQTLDETTDGTDVASRVEAGMPDLFDAIQEATSLQINYQTARAALKGKPDAAYFRVVAAKARGLAITSVLFAATFLRRAAPKDRAKAEEAAMMVRKLYDAIVAAEAVAAVAPTPKAARKAAVVAETARMRCQVSLLDVMAIVDPPAPPPKLPPRSVQVEDCEMCVTGGLKGRNSLVHDRNRDLEPEEKRMVAYVQDQALTFLAHLLAKYPKDTHTKTLNAHWCRRVVAMAESYDTGPTMVAGGAAYTRCISLSMDVMPGVQRALASLLHELSHIAADADGHEPHTSGFYSVNRKFLRIATEDLGWTTETWCREACDLPKDPIDTVPRSACPKCTWQASPDVCLPAVQAQPTVCRPDPNAESNTQTSPDPTAADMPSMRSQASDAASRASKTLMAITNAKMDERDRALATAQAQRCVAANKRLESSRNASPELASSLSQIAVAAAQAADNIVKDARPAPKPRLT